MKAGGRISWRRRWSGFAVVPESVAAYPPNQRPTRDGANRDRRRANPGEGQSRVQQERLQGIADRVLSTQTLRLQMRNVAVRDGDLDAAFGRELHERVGERCRFNLNVNGFLERIIGARSRRPSDNYDQRRQPELSDSQISRGFVCHERRAIEYGFHWHPRQ